MRYDHAVKCNGVYYKTGEDVPLSKGAEMPDGMEREVDTKKPGRPKKAAGQ